MEREPKTKEQEAKERDYQIYRKPEDKPSCDKFAHSERSRNNDTGQHDKHWQKEERKKNDK